MSNIFIGLLALITILFCWKTLSHNPAKNIAGQKFYITKEYPTSYSNAVDNLNRSTIFFNKDGRIEYTVVNDYINEQWILHDNKIEMGSLVEPDRTYIDLDEKNSVDGHDFYALKTKEGSNVFTYFLVAEKQ